MKQYRYDYHSKEGWLNRAWIDAENDDHAMTKALEECRMWGREFLKGSLKEVGGTAVKDFTDAGFEAHAKSFISALDDE